uniref:Uncharacterized protein n=1 Tax=Tanacetum cinerariifolium TaxID=118510 RepID=A0A6L2NPT5_TANCI|nr:hypothetical protein [Tanacetum cinerariifolium]GEY11363.1 hypothetical protein [Tanacetum cinerariifolium]
MMTKPTMAEYIAINRINYRSGSEEKGKIKLKGRFLTELRKYAFSGTNGEDEIEHIGKFLKVVDSLNVPNVTHDRLRLNVFLISLTGAASGDDEEFEWTNLEDMESIEGDKVPKVFIETNVFQFKTPLCKPFKEFNSLFQIDVDALTYDIPGIKTYDEFKDEWMNE